VVGRAKTWLSPRSKELVECHVRAIDWMLARQMRLA
jgi:hypothetical protein